MENVGVFAVVKVNNVVHMVAGDWTGGWPESGSPVFYQSHTGWNTNIIWLLCI